MKTWNTLVPVVELIVAGSAQEAIDILSQKLRDAGFGPYTGHARTPDAFESEDS